MEPVKYQLSKREFVFATAFRFMLSKKFVVAEIALLILTLICWFLESSLFDLAVFPIACAIFLPIFTFYRINKIVKANPDLFVSEKTLSADKDGIKSSSATTSSNLNWSVFKKWSENNKYIFIYFVDLQAVTIPKRAFTSKQLTEFKTLLAEKIRPS